MSKLDVMNAYHCGTKHKSHVGAFANFLLLVPYNDVIIRCIDLVLPMGWVDSPKCFCTFLETLFEMANALVDAYLFGTKIWGNIRATGHKAAPPPTPRRASPI